MPEQAIQMRVGTMCCFMRSEHGGNAELKRGNLVFAVSRDCHLVCVGLCLSVCVQDRAKL